MKVSEILTIKGKVLYTVAPSVPLFQAVETMVERDIGSLVVMEHGKLVGMLTFREILQALHANHGDLRQGLVRERMHENPLQVTADMAINTVRALMLRQHARYVPVMQDTVLLGVISFYDVAKAVLDEQGYENQMLKAYIKDWPETA